jgi:hypothetical protein
MINTLIDSFSEAQLKNVLSMLENLKAFVDEAEDDAYCNKLYDDCKADPESADGAVELSEFANELGISLS